MRTGARRRRSDCVDRIALSIGGQLLGTPVGELEAEVVDGGVKFVAGEVGEDVAFWGHGGERGSVTLAQAGTQRIGEPAG